MTKKVAAVLAIMMVGAGVKTYGGPPFLTDDPEPVDYQNWEFYIASMHTQTADGWSGTAPHIEVNYGVVTNVQLHLIAPLAYNAPADGKSHYGYGDTELGVKFRFIQETEHMPQVGVFPLLEVPTGSESEGLGTGHWDAFLPMWLQKSFGDWTAYGGGGYGINPGAGNENWGFVGGVLQKQVRKNICSAEKSTIAPQWKPAGAATRPSISARSLILPSTSICSFPPDAQLTARRTFSFISPGNSRSARNSFIPLATGSAISES